MAQWSAPFHAPKFTDDEFEKQKAAYVAKHGYAITVPTIGDIIHLSAFKPMTAEEKRLWAAKEYDKIPEGRREDIREEKYRKKQKYLAMLADPAPQIARTAAAILTAVDDLQDAVSTIACIGLIAAAVIGGPVAAAVAGPLGLILGASTLLNVINPLSHINKPFKFVPTGRAAKKRLESMTDHNPFSKEAKVKMAKRIKNFRPTVGNALEALQTTDQIFGVGVSLGPIVGFVQSAIAGVIRTGMGEKVAIQMKAERDPNYMNPAARAANANALLHSIEWQSDATDETMSIYAASLAMQALYPSIEAYNPFDEVPDLDTYLVECPQPTDILTREVLAEEGIDPDNACVWPQNGQRWISLGELQETVAELAPKNLAHYAAENNHTMEAFNALTAADDFALNFLCAVEGPENVLVDYLHTERIVISILDKGWIYPADITPDQIAKFEDWCYVHDYMDTQPTGRDIWRYAETFCGFRWAKSPEEAR